MKIACPKCGANLEFLPTEQKCFCEHCKSHIDINELKLNLNHNSDLNECTCSSCGAKLIVRDTSITTNCIYCGSNQLIIKRIQGKYKPNYILPFMISKEIIEKHLKSFVKKHNLPIELIENFKNTQLNSVYVPYFIFSWKMVVYYRCRYNFFEYIDYKDAGKQFDDNIMQKIHPFDIYNLVDFNPAYLAGFYADTLNENERKIKKRSRKKVYKEVSDCKIKKQILEKIINQNFYLSPSEVEEEPKEKIFALKCNKKFVLLPVYFFNVKNKDDVYTFSMNGRTGRSVCCLHKLKEKEVLFEENEQKIQNKSLFIYPENFENDTLIHIKEVLKKITDIKLIIVGIMFLLGIIIFVLLFFWSLSEKLF